MKKLIIFCFLFFIQMNAQSSHLVNLGNKQAGLTKSELKAAKDGYIQMMKSETYILNKKKQSSVTKKLKDVKLPFIEVTSLNNMEDME